MSGRSAAAAAHTGGVDRVLDSDVDWLRHDVGAVGTVAYAVPGRFEVYGVIDLPEMIAADEDELLSALAPDAAEELVAGWIDRGPWRPPPGDEHVLHSGWKYRFRRVRAAELRGLPGEGEGGFPDLLFDSGRSWLLSLLWDDSWRSVGTTRAMAQRLRQRVPAFESLRADADLAATGRVPN